MEKLTDVVKNRDTKNEMLKEIVIPYANQNIPAVVFTFPWLY